MEILNNFASIYCFIAFVIGAVLMLVALAIAAMGKDDEPTYWFPIPKLPKEQEVELWN